MIKVGWCDDHLKTQDPYGNSHTWFSLGLVDEAVEDQKGHNDLYEFQRNVRASKHMRCYTNEWNLGIPAGDKDPSSEVDGWIESLAEARDPAIGVFPFARYPGWVNSVWKMEVWTFPRNTIECERSNSTGHADCSNAEPMLRRQHSSIEQIVGREEAITVTREAVKATPEDHPDRAGGLDNLGSLLCNRYLRTGAMTDLEESIAVAQKAVEATPDNHPDRARWLSNLGLRLGDRYLRTGAMADLEESITIAQEAVKATPEDHPNQAALLNNLGDRLGNRYSRTGAMADLEELITIARESVKATPEDHPDRARRLNNLGVRLSDRYSRTGAMADLEESITIAREAVKATPEDHPNRAGRLDNLGLLLGDRYSRTRAMADLEESITFA
ncbi:hypothetical protein CSUB01_12134 [Colletotrichum sublineola]|uniref:TPR domain-containing protein n=1 Tax=Colletotrichum sublineola TaxID=1173701 RepID=A0A066X2S1_COLSU|nr:hypothetical protein CSUB01_12134 [Colletotrichum sublineola]